MDETRCLLSPLFEGPGKIMSILVAKLHNGVFLPAVGLGTYKLHNDEAHTIPAIKSALKLGYRLIDTAEFYDNERDLGKAVHEMEGQAPGEMGKALETTHFPAVTEKEFLDNFAVPHGPVSDKRIAFVTGKVWITSFEPALIRAYVEAHLKHFNRTSTDLILLHWPGWVALLGDKENAHTYDHARRVACWKTLEELYAEKKCRAIGVSNYMVKHLQSLIEDIETRRSNGDTKATIPHVNQIEISPVCQPAAELVTLMREHDIHFTAYSPLGSERGVEYIRNIPLLNELAKKHNRPLSAVVMRWALQSGYCVVPKSAQSKHQEENLQILGFSLEQDDINAIKKLDEQKRFCPDPYLIN